MSVSTDKNFDEKLLKLQSWLKELYGDCEVIPHESSIASGFSNETFVFDVKGKNVSESLVLRLRPTGYQVFPDYDLKMQASIMKLLRLKGLPTPEIIFENYNDDISHTFHSNRSDSQSSKSIQLSNNITILK